MFTFLHTADIHLDSPLWRLERYEGAPVEVLRLAPRDAFINLVDLAISESVDFVLICGDLYDGDWKDYNTGLFFAAQMARLREAGIPAFIIAGNHDALSRMTKSLSLPAGIHLMDTQAPESKVLEDIRVVIHGQGFETPAVKRDLSTDFPPVRPYYFNIGMLHTAATGRPGHEPYAPCTVAGLRAKGYDYWALGHVHQHEILSRDPWIVFPGNIQGRHIGETGPKGCLLVEVDDVHRIKVRFRPLDVIRWEHVRIGIDDLQDPLDVIARVRRHLQERLRSNDGLPLISRIVLGGATKAHRELAADPNRWINQIRAAVVDAAGDRIWIEKLKIETHPPEDARKHAPAEGPVSEVLDCLATLQTDPQHLAKLGTVLHDLVRKLPAELTQGAEAVAPDDPDWMRHLLDHVESLLMKRLLTGPTPK